MAFNGGGETTESGPDDKDFDSCFGFGGCVDWFGTGACFDVCVDGHLERALSGNPFRQMSRCLTVRDCLYVFYVGREDVLGFVFLAEDWLFPCFMWGFGWLLRRSHIAYGIAEIVDPSLTPNNRCSSVIHGL